LSFFFEVRISVQRTPFYDLFFYFMKLTSCSQLWVNGLGLLLEVKLSNRLRISREILSATQATNCNEYRQIFVYKICLSVSDPVSDGATKRLVLNIERT